MKKRLLSLLLLLPALLLFSACRAESDPASTRMEKADHVFRGTYLAIPEDISLQQNSMSLSGDTLTFRAYRSSPDESGSTNQESLLCQFSLDDGSATLREIPRKMTEAAE